MFTLDFRSDQQTRDSGATLDDKAFASLSALFTTIMPTCEGIHAMILFCVGNFLRT